MMLSEKVVTASMLDARMLSRLSTASRLTSPDSSHGRYGSMTADRTAIRMPMTPMAEVRTQSCLPRRDISHCQRDITVSLFGLCDGRKG